ncbi:hypothetical protein INR49_022129 [Caranx melampygus]|nr:hypothetical protein INR49_022129 [Caranx melampygus]
MAAEELFRVRTDFIERASKPLISQLLGDLLKEKIINDLENESILEEHNTRADKAGALIDTVRKKGDMASESMITHLQNRDATLHSQLGLGLGYAQATPLAALKCCQLRRLGLALAHPYYYKELWREKQKERNVTQPEELFRVRTDFIERASKPLISQLLGDLLAEKIISDLENESILEDHNTRADKAGALLIQTEDYAGVMDLTHHRHQGILGEETEKQKYIISEELFRVRTDFIERASKPLISQLLGDLLTENIITDLENESILEEHNARADKAGALVDTVRKKGDVATEELFRVRTDFIERASKPLISQLLGDLLTEKIISDLENESILEDHNTRADKARALIDTVRKKGDVASERMIAHLKNRDNILHATLGLGPAQPAPLAAEPQTEQKRSTSLIHTTKNFWEKKQNDRNIYPVPVNNSKNRVALLITNIEFKDKEMNRKGGEKDEENMEKLLTALGYLVIKHRNLTGKEIEDTLIQFSKHEKVKETDSVVVVIMSHGKCGAVLGVNSVSDEDTQSSPDEFHIDKIYELLSPSKCRALLNKPKIIIIQACRGGQRGSVLLSDGAKPSPAPIAEEDIEEDTLQVVHKEKDFISLLSCTPDTVSYRHRDQGSLLIQYIVDIFNNHAHEDDIEELFRKVMQRFEDFAPGSRRQMPTKDRCTLTKRFYFFPGV